MLRRGQAIVSAKRRLAHKLSSPDRPGTLPGPEGKRRTPRKQLGRGRATIGLTRNAGWRGYRQAHRLATERRSAAPEDDPGGAKSRKSWLCSGVQSGSRGACALRPRSDTSGSTSTCGREAGGTLHQPAPRQEAQFASPGASGSRLLVGWTYVRGRRSRGSGRATRAPVTGAPRCRWWTARSRCWPCARRPGKRAKRCASAWGRTRSSCARRTTARSSRPAGRLPRRASFFFAQPYRGLNEHVNELVRQYKATDFRSPAEPRGKPARQPASQGAGLPDYRGSFQAGD